MYVLLFLFIVLCGIVAASFVCKAPLRRVKVRRCALCYCELISTDGKYCFECEGVKRMVNEQKLKFDDDVINAYNAGFLSAESYSYYRQYDSPEWHEMQRRRYSFGDPSVPHQLYIQDVVKHAVEAYRESLEEKLAVDQARKDLDKTVFGFIITDKDGMTPEDVEAIKKAVFPGMTVQELETALKRRDVYYIPMVRSKPDKSIQPPKYRTVTMG